LERKNREDLTLIETVLQAEQQGAAGREQMWEIRCGTNQGRKESLGKLVLLHIGFCINNSSHCCL